MVGPLVYGKEAERSRVKERKVEGRKVEEKVTEEGWAVGPSGVMERPSAAGSRRR